MDSQLFIQEWIRRAERKEGCDFIDIGDKFISLWIAFNAWLKTTFGEELQDRELIKRVKEYSFLENIFCNLRKDNDFEKRLNSLKEYRVLNMRFPTDSSKMKHYDDSYPSLIDVIYQIRCNLFHGRKNYEVDKELVELAYFILLYLFKKYLLEIRNTKSYSF